MEKGKITGRLILKEISFERVWKKVVVKNNATSGKVQLHKDLIGKEVYIVYAGGKK